MSSKRENAPQQHPGPVPTEQAGVTAAPPDKKAPGQISAAPAPAPPAPSAAHSSPARKAIFAASALVVLALVCWVGIPMILLALNTVSTDDAYVNSHVTAVAARVDGQVKKEGVLVDDNYYVKKGQKLVELDKEPLQDVVNIKKANLEKARADLKVAEAQVVSMVDKARASRFNLEHTIDEVNNKIGELRRQFEALAGELPKREFARQEYARYVDLMKTPGATTQQILDQKKQDLDVARANVGQSLQTILQIRAYLGLPAIIISADEIKQPPPRELVQTPHDLSQTYSGVRQAAAELMQAVAPLGLTASSFDLRPQQILDEFLERDPQWKRAVCVRAASVVGFLVAPHGEATCLWAAPALYSGKTNDEPGAVDRILREVIVKAPTIAQARAAVDQAKEDLAQAELNLNYTDVYAEIDGVVTRRAVNPGNNVKAGQSLMAIRSLTEIWIDANFKETQLGALKIGQPAKIEVDMYGSRYEFNGHITGFTMGTGQTLALLPPQNATGNFVKIVQRLPVKIELIDYDPGKTPRPLFVGTSVTPYVYINEKPVGDDPNNGKFLRLLTGKEGKR